MTKEERKELVVEVMEILTRKKEERKKCEKGLGRQSGGGDAGINGEVDDEGREGQK